MRLMGRLSLTIFCITCIVMAASCPIRVLAQGKMDADLLEVLENAAPSDLVGVIIIFHEKPTLEQIDTLEAVHRVKISHYYEIINGVAGEASAEVIPRVAEYSWVQGIWLDKKLYVTENKAVETSRLVEELQTENDELREAVAGLEQEISTLREQVQKQYIIVSQLELKLKTYSVGSFLAGLLIGLSWISSLKEK